MEPEARAAVTRRVALTRAVSSSLPRCELTHLARAPIDLDRARSQHGDYERLLAGLGCEVVRLPPLDDHPDAVFVEDTAVVLDELAVVTRPGAASRRGEAASTAAALARLLPVVTLEAPATLDGGDVLRVGRTLYVGRTTRTGGAGVAALAALVEPAGYRVAAVSVSSCLHLKSAVIEVAPGLLLLNPSWVDPAVFRDHELLEVDPAEPAAANALRIGASIVYPSAFEGTRRRLEQRGLDVRTVDLSELALAEGAVTCCSLIVERPRAQPSAG